MNSDGLGEHPFVCWKHVNPRGRNLSSRVTIENEQPTLGSRILLGSSVERTQFTFDCFGRFEGRTHLYEFLTAIPMADQEVDLQTLGGLHVAHLSSPALELVQDSRLERVTQVRASAGIEGWNQPRAPAPPASEHRVS